MNVFVPLGQYLSVFSIKVLQQNEHIDLQELQMDQQAKKHLQDEFDAALEEKDQMITVLQTQVSALICE